MRIIAVLCRSPTALTGMVYRLRKETGMALVSASVGVALSFAIGGMCNRIIIRLVAFGGLAAFSHFVSAADLTGQVTLAQALALTLKQNPDLAAFSWDVRSAEARILQARLWPNPELGTQSEDIGFSRVPGS